MYHSLHVEYKNLDFSGKYIKLLVYQLVSLRLVLIVENFKFHALSLYRCCKHLFLTPHTSIITSTIMIQQKINLFTLFHSEQILFGIHNL